MGYGWDNGRRRDKLATIIFHRGRRLGRRRREEPLQVPVRGVPAIFRRNRLVEEQYEIKIAETRYPYAQYSDVYALLKKAALAQADDYDLYTVVFPNAYSGIICASR